MWLQRMHLEIKGEFVYILFVYSLFEINKW